MTSQPPSVAAGYVYVWEYRVQPQSVAAFEEVYGPGGAWVRLFREHAGYLRTELLRDQHDRLRYWSIDWWRSREDWEAFRAVAAEPFTALDRQCELLTSSELCLGELEPAGLD